MHLLSNKPPWYGRIGYGCRSRRCRYQLPIVTDEMQMSKMPLDARPDKNSLLQFLLKLFVSSSLLAILIAHVDAVALQRAFERSDWRDVLAATLILIVLTPLLAWRWRRVALAIGMPLSGRAALVIVLIGMFFNQVMPSAIGGDLMRLWLLRIERVPVAKGLSSIFLDRVVSLFGMMLVVVAGFSVLLQIVRQPAMQFGAVILIAAVFVGTGVLVWADKIPWPFPVRIRSSLVNVSAFAIDARSLFFSPRVLGAVLFASILIHLLVSLAVWLLARGIGLSVGIEVFVLLMPLVLLLSLLPISIAGWGVREGTMIACLSLVAVDTASAFAVSALFGFASLFASLPGAIVWLLTGRGQDIDAKPSATE